RQGQSEVSTAAKRAIALAEARVRDAVGTLDTLAAAGVSSCDQQDMEAMRRAAFSTIPVKEIAIIGPDGKTLCNHLGLPPGEREVVSSEPLVCAGGYRLDIISLPGGERMVRLRRDVGSAHNSISALVPTVLFLPQVSTGGGPFSGYARIVTAQGATIGEVGGRKAESESANFSADIRSNKFGFDVEVLSPRARIEAEHANLKWFSLFTAGVIMITVTGFVVLIPRRSPRNPVAEIERALEAGEFVPYYQPIVDIRSGQLRGAEVLIRWRKPDGTIVPPASFIPLAESSGLIIELTRVLMRRVCREAGAVLGARPHLKIGFNLTACHFANEEIVDDVRKIFKKSPLKLTQVVLEVTERQPIENLTETRRVVAALQGLGVKVAIDDVGTGHSGLSYMLKLGVDIIKIDKMFIDSIGTDRNSNTIIETLIDLAQNMRMDVIAEGVESFEQVLHLRELGIRAAQGFVFSPPLPCAAFLELVATIDPIKAVGDSAADEPGAAIAALARDA